jgi:fructosamine-3-kinase
MISNPADKYGSILHQTFGEDTFLKSYRLIASGNLNQAVFLETNKGAFFLKTNSEPTLDIYEKEINGLDLLRQNTFLKVPQTFGHGNMEELNYLLMEWVPESRIGKNYWEELAQGLAKLHQKTASRFGLKEDNYIAVLPQINKVCAQWSEFFIEHRIEKMLQMALNRGLIDTDFLEKFRSIYNKISAIFPNEKPSLIHGDLWSGNVLVNGEGNPAIIDPAVYFGQREMDLAFSKLFGGFSDRFYSAYEEAFPTPPGFLDRIEVYNLYPLLVHLNLFGKTYLSPIERVVNKYFR